MISYCLRCKTKTETIDEQDFISKNGKPMKRGTCAVCNTIKTRFISTKTQGGSLLNTAINKLPFEAHMPGGYQFLGPGTNLKKRLKPDLTPQPWSQPINRVDEAAYHHDVCYLKNKDTSTRNKICDKKMLEDLKDIHNPTLRERLDRSIVDKIIDTKMKFGMGTSRSPKGVGETVEKKP